MRRWLSPRRLAMSAVVLLVAIQLIPVWLWQTNPAAQSQPKWDSAQTQALTQRACFDCHSNQTTGGPGCRCHRPPRRADRPVD